MAPSSDTTCDGEIKSCLSWSMSCVFTVPGVTDDCFLALFRIKPLVNKSDLVKLAMMGTWSHAAARPPPPIATARRPTLAACRPLLRSATTACCCLLPPATADRRRTRRRPPPSPAAASRRPPPPSARLDRNQTLIQLIN